MRKIILLVLCSTNFCVTADSEHQVQQAKVDIQNEQLPYDMQTELPFPEININEVFNVFLGAVDRGQLKLFEKTLSRNMLIPIRVEFVYTTESLRPMIKVYSVLKKPLPIPSVPEANIIGVSGVMDASGNIIEAIAHCDIEA